MSKRVKINEIVRETGLSRATVDRALNGRGGIHPRTEKAISDAVERLGQQTHDAPSLANTGDSVDAILRLGRGLAVQVEAALLEHRLPLTFMDMYQRDEEEMLDAVIGACEDTSRPLILTAKNSERLSAVLTQARKRGKRVVTLVSDLPHDCRDAFVGIDNRMAGQAVAFLVGNLLKDHGSSTVGVVLGDYAFNCHEDREIGFRSHLRAHFPDVHLADVAKGEDSPEQTYRAVKDLLDKYPDISAIYNVAGGNAGLAKALREADLVGKVVVITHEANSITAPLTRDGVLQYLVAQDPSELIKLAVSVASIEPAQLSKEQHLIDFGLYTRFNIPKFGAEVVG